MLKLVLQFSFFFLNFILFEGFLFCYESVANKTSWLKIVVRLDEVCFNL